MSLKLESRRNAINDRLVKMAFVSLLVWPSLPNQNTKVIFTKPPLMAFRRDSNLRDILVHSKLKKREDNPGNYPCKHPRCRTCNHVSQLPTIQNLGNSFTVHKRYTCSSACLICYKMQKVRNFMHWRNLPTIKWKIWGAHQERRTQASRGWKEKRSKWYNISILRDIPFRTCPFLVY